MDSDVLNASAGLQEKSEETQINTLVLLKAGTFYKLLPYLRRMLRNIIEKLKVIMVMCDIHNMITYRYIIICDVI